MENLNFYKVSEGQSGKILFGDFEETGKTGIWLSYNNCYYVLFPDELMKMLTHVHGEMIASRKEDSNRLKIS